MSRGQEGGLAPAALPTRYRVVVLTADRKLSRYLPFLSATNGK
jgi:hypothetical protein